MKRYPDQHFPCRGRGAFGGMKFMNRYPDILIHISPHGAWGLLTQEIVSKRYPDPHFPSERRGAFCSTKFMNRYPDPHFPSRGVGPFDERNSVETISRSTFPLNGGVWPLKRYPDQHFPSRRRGAFCATKFMNRYPDPRFPSQGVGPFDARHYIETIS